MNTKEPNSGWYLEIFSKMKNGNSLDEKWHQAMFSPRDVIIANIVLSVHNFPVPKRASWPNYQFNKGKSSIEIVVTYRIPLHG